jgi:hypothetical protein
VVHFTDNDVVALDAWVKSICAWPGVQDSWLLVANNRLAGENALWVDPETFSGVKCQAVNNDVRQITGDVWVLNGNPCKVVGRGRTK